MNDKNIAFCRKAFSARDGYRAIILLMLSGSILLSLLIAGSNLALAKAWDRSPVQQEADGETDGNPAGAASTYRVLAPFVSGAGPVSYTHLGAGRCGAARSDSLEEPLGN